jgi:hypothetical protein
MVLLKSKNSGKLSATSESKFLQKKLDNSSILSTSMEMVQYLMMN